MNPTASSAPPLRKISANWNRARFLSFAVVPVHSGNMSFIYSFRTTADPRWAPTQLYLPKKWAKLNPTWSAKIGKSFSIGGTRTVLQQALDNLANFPPSQESKNRPWPKCQNSIAICSSGNWQTENLSHRPHNDFRWKSRIEESYVSAELNWPFLDCLFSESQNDQGALHSQDTRVIPSREFAIVPIADDLPQKR